MSSIKRVRSFIEVPIKANDAGNMEVPTEIQVMPIGSWIGSNHGDFVITTSDLDLFVQNFNQNVRLAVPIDLEHKSMDGAVGWVVKLVKRDDGLWATVEWTPQGVQLLADRTYRFFSPEFYLDGYEDPESGQIFSNVLIGGALTNRPFFKELTPLMASDGTVQNDDGSAVKTEHKNIINLFAEEGEAKIVNLDEVRVKDANGLSEDERKFLADHKDDLTADEQTKFGLVAAANDGDAGDGAGEGNTDGDGKAEEVANAEVQPNEPVAEPVVASDSKTGKEGEMVSLTASEVATLRAAAKKLEHKEASDIVSKHVARGAIKSDQQEKIVGLMLANEDTRPGIEEMLNNLPDNKLIVAGEVGKNESEPTGSAVQTVRIKANELVKEAREAGKTLEIGDAMAKVFKDNPELSDQYNAELKG